MRILKHSPVSQYIPVKPATQRHVYELTASVHVASFLQGLLPHSSISKTYNSERVGHRSGWRGTEIRSKWMHWKREAVLVKCPHVKHNSHLHWPLLTTTHRVNQDTMILIVSITTAASVSLTHLSRSVFPCNRRHSDTCTSWQRQCTSLHFYKDCWRIRRYLKHKHYILNVYDVVVFQDGAAFKDGVTRTFRLETLNDCARAALCSQTSSSVCGRPSVARRPVLCVGGPL